MRNIATRSLRGAAGTVTPGYSAGMSCAGSGFCTWLRNWASFLGTDELNLSFLPSGITTSLTRGMPRRDTLIQLPELAGSAPLVDSTRVLRRSVCDHTPMMALGSSGPVGALPFAVSLLIGTCRAMLWML